MIEGGAMTDQHTCASAGRSGCTPCMKFEVDLWDAINRYAISVGGDPSNHVYGNDARMTAVADVGTIIGRVYPRAIPINAECQTLIGTIGACGTDGHYCSDRCWLIGKARAAEDLLRGYLRRLGVEMR